MARKAVYKTCKRCSKVKLTEDFGRQATYKDGFRPWCFDCHNDYAKENKVAYNARCRERYQSDKDFREAKIAASKRWREAHPAAYRLTSSSCAARRLFRKRKAKMGLNTTGPVEI